MDYPQTRVHYDSDWTPMYIILAAIPAIFITVAVFSKWVDRVRAKRELHHEGAK